MQNHILRTHDNFTEDAAKLEADVVLTKPGQSKELVVAIERRRE